MADNESFRETEKDVSAGLRAWILWGGLCFPISKQPRTEDRKETKKHTPMSDLTGQFFTAFLVENCAVSSALTRDVCSQVNRVFI